MLMNSPPAPLDRVRFATDSLFEGQSKNEQPECLRQRDESIDAETSERFRPERADRARLEANSLMR
jgi:hypothetical protein